MEMPEPNAPNPLLESLQNDLKYYSDYLQGLSREVLDSGTSKYPVFVAHQEAGGIEIGRPILQHEQIETRWSINISLMEEFVAKGIVPREQFAAFKQSWKDPEEYMCVFVLAGAASSFAYLPYTPATPDESDAPATAE
jgi:hypothetical protein